MLTDWVLTARLALELEERLRGARFRDAGLLDDGRVGLLLRSRGTEAILAVDLFASPPHVTLEAGELAVGPEPGFASALVRSLRGMTLERVWARRGDRVLRLTFAARSRFGVDDRFELFGKASILEYVDVLAGGPVWDTVRDRDKIDMVWVRPDRGLAKRLLKEPDWTVIYRDKISILFTHGNRAQLTAR